MAFRLPSNLVIREQYLETLPSNVTALEESLPSGSRMLVGLVFSERYSGFEEDCSKANEILSNESGLSTWEDYPIFVTPDIDGEPIAWVSYTSSPAFWTIILLILGGIFILPILSVLPVWIIDKMLPGFTEIIGILVMLAVMGGVMLFLPKMLAPTKKEEEKKA